MDELFKRYEEKIVELAEANKQRDMAIRIVISLKTGEIDLDQIEATEGGFKVSPKGVGDAGG